MLPTFIFGIETWGDDLKKSHLKVFEEGHEDTYDVSRQSVFFDNLSCFVGRIWRTSHGDYMLLC